MSLSLGKRSKPGTTFVLALGVSLFFFAIHLKVSPPVMSQSPDGSPTQIVKLWADPNQTLETKTKVAPIGFILLFLVAFCAGQMEGPAERVLNLDAVLPNLLARLPNRFRPPPHN